MGFQILAPPAVEPVSVEQAKLFARIDTDADDALLPLWLAAARRQCEVYTGRKFVTQKIRMYLDAFPGYIDQRLGGNIVSTPIAIGATSYMAGIRWAIVPAYAPVQGIDAVTFESPAGTPVTMLEDVDYTVDVISRPARITPIFGKFWPIARIKTNAVWVDWTAGYGGPIAVSMAAGSALLSGAKFYQHDIGKAITIPGAGGTISPLAPADLVTSIVSVDANGIATLADQAVFSVAGIVIWWGDPVPQNIQIAILMLVAGSYYSRESATEKQLLENPAIARLLSPERDLRF